MYYTPIVSSLLVNAMISTKRLQTFFMAPEMETLPDLDWPGKMKKKVPSTYSFTTVIYFIDSRKGIVINSILGLHDIPYNYVKEHTCEEKIGERLKGPSELCPEWTNTPQQTEGNYFELSWCL